MDQHSYQQYDAVGLAELVRLKHVSAKELVDCSFGQIDKVNDQINAVIRQRKEKVYQELADSSAEGQPFYGVPLLVKDISQEIKGEVTSAGSKLLTEHVARSDANFVAKLRKAGFMLIGQTNTPEFGLKNITEPELYGPTRNPWQLDYSPGGSSGGAAAAVAAGIVPVAGASDGGGSIRIPAGFTGLFGLKPTRGRTPVGPGVGRQWQGAAIDFVLSRSVRDSAALLDVLQTVQPEAAFQTPFYPGRFFDLLHKSYRPKYRIGFTTASPVQTEVSEEAKQSVLRVAKWLEEAGHVVEEVEAPVNGVELMRHYYMMNSGEMNRVISRLETNFARTLTEQDMDIFTWVLHQAGKSVSAAQYSESLNGWDQAAAQMNEFHQSYDFYLTPTNAGGPPKIGELTPSEQQIDQFLKVDHLSGSDQQQQVYDMFLPSLAFTPFTQLANLTGQPAMSVPVGLNAAGLPLGVQVVAAKGREDLLLSLASLIEQSELWLKQMPGF
ncbi:amidase [Amphibacillus marinus]|uniref:Amidase n=1 Tax=Amphibacillus marinus TaxID=872970 RepID=A0A1H8L294_9BACI|nr:amidase [Amphibacillus marinus]SEN99292.1 amidase [Amphibacillus marinus]